MSELFGAAAIDALDAADERAQRESERRDELLGEAMRGAGQFWPTGRDFTKYGSWPAWDGEQFMPVFAAVREAMARPELSDARRWEIISETVITEAMEYARARAHEET